MANGDDDPYGKFPVKPLPDNWQAPQPMTGRGAEPNLPPGYTSTGPPKSPSEPPSVRHALWDMIPNPEQAWDWFKPRAQYVAGRAAQGFSENMMPAEMLGHALSPTQVPDPGKRPDVGTGAVGAYAEDAMRNPLVTATYPVRSAVAAGIGEASEGLPTGVRAGLELGAALPMRGVLNWRSLLHNAYGAAGLGIPGEYLFGHGGMGAAIGAAIPAAAQLGRNILNTGLRPIAARGAINIYQGMPEADPNRAP